MTTASGDDMPQWQLNLIALAGIAILIGFSVAGFDGWGQLYAVTFVAAGLVIAMFWQARRELRLWVAVLGLALAQLVAITLAYPANSALVSGYKMLPFELADFALFYGVAWCTQRRAE